MPQNIGCLKTNKNCKEEQNIGKFSDDEEFLKFICVMQSVGLKDIFRLCG